MNTIRIGLVDDHPVVRKGLISLLQEFNHIQVIFDVGDGRELFETLPSHPVHMVLLDLEMPGMNGKESFDKLRQLYPDVRILLFSMHDTEAFVSAFLKKGAAAFLSKQADISTIVRAIEEVQTKGHYFDTRTLEIRKRALMTRFETKQRRTDKITLLTGREVEILRMICANRSIQEIAGSLVLSVRTVEGYKTRIKQKTACKNLLELVAFAQKHKLLSDKMGSY